MSAALEAQYLRLLRWYPKQWRERNEAAVVGVLLDQAENEARTAPSAADRASLLLGGLRERFRRGQRPSALMVVSHACALAFSVWYLAVIAWAPDITVAGAVGSFTNPAVISAALLALALVLGLARRPRLAMVASAAGAATAAIVFVLAVTLGWLGPGPVPTVMLVGLGVAGALQSHSRRESVVIPIAVAFAALSVLGFTVAVQTYPVIFAVQFWVWGLLGVAAGAGAVLLIAITIVDRGTAR